MPIVRHRQPSAVSYVIWLLAWILLKPLLTLGPINKLRFRVLASSERNAQRRRPSRAVVIEKIRLGGRPTELVMAKAPTAGATDTAILYLHGGGFLSCGPGTHRTITTSLAKELGIPVFALDYRQLPEAGVGTAVHDAVEAYRELLGQRGFSHVVVAGDSAGGFLTGKVAELAAANDLPAPTALAMLSPWLDLEIGDNDDRTSRHDAYLPMRQLAVVRPMLDQGPVPLAGTSNILDVAPEAFPPTIVITAEQEMLEPDALEFVEGLDAAGRRAVLHSYPWQIHAFTVPLRHREGAESVRLVVDFLDEAIREAHTGNSGERRQSEAS